MNTVTLPEDVIRTGAPDAILVVDDSSLVLDLMRFSLKELGMTILTAASAREAMDRLKDANVKLVITDLRMPEVDGFAFMKRLRAMPAYKELPVVVLTGSEIESCEQHSYDAGATAFLHKPFVPRDISAFIQKQLQKDKIRRLRAQMQQEGEPTPTGSA